MTLPPVVKAVYIINKTYVDGHQWMDKFDELPNIAEMFTEPGLVSVYITRKSPLRKDLG